MSRDKAIDVIGSQIGEICPGHHVELCPARDYLIFGDLEMGSAMTEDQWLADMKVRGYKLISNDELQKSYACTGFTAGLFVGYLKNDPKKEKVVLDFTRSPAGHRYYF
jgi:hypothetical protein